VRPRERDAEGFLQRRTVSPVVEVYIGKETNRLEDVQMGLIHNLGEMLDAYPEARRGSWERLVRPVLQDIPASWLMERTGLSRRTIQRLRNGHSVPRREHEESLTVAAAEFAREQLQRAGQEAPADDLLCVRAYVQSQV
jgi:hypothetical protein